MSAERLQVRHQVNILKDLTRRHVKNTNLCPLVHVRLPVCIATAQERGLDGSQIKRDSVLLFRSPENILPQVFPLTTPTFRKCRTIYEDRNSHIIGSSKVV
jgi:hypothetical protein